MRLLVGVAAGLLVLAGCSTEAGHPVAAKQGCDLFDQHAVATALATREPVVKHPSKTVTDCVLNLGTPPQISVMVTARPDNPKFGYAAWLKIVQHTGQARELTPPSGDKAFVGAEPDPHGAIAGVLHAGTFYEINVLAESADSVKTATGMVDVLEAALSG